MGSGSYISETCPTPSPLCWCCSLQPTTQMVRTHCLWSTANWTGVFKESDRLVFICAVMIPAYTLNRFYSIFFIAFSVIGKLADGLLIVVLAHEICLMHAAPWQEPTVWWTYWRPSSITSSEGIYWWVTCVVWVGVVPSCFEPETPGSWDMEKQNTTACPSWKSGCVGLNVPGALEWDRPSLAIMWQRRTALNVNSVWGWPET